MWQDYAAPQGTFRENLYGTPGKPYLPDDHPGSKFKWNYKAPDSEDEVVDVDISQEAKTEQII